MQVIYERCAGVDVGKDVIAVAVRRQRCDFAAKMAVLRLLGRRPSR
jgi:hypothetical protein